MSYTINWELSEVVYTAEQLQQWTTSRLKTIADDLVARRRTVCEDSIDRMLGQEFRDWVTRGGERYTPCPDLGLDTYWKASWGVAGY